MVALATFVTVFVVASTFAFTVAQRRRELGLLRAIGATPRAGAPIGPARGCWRWVRWPRRAAPCWASCHAGPRAGAGRCRLRASHLTVAGLAARGRSSPALGSGPVVALLGALRRRDGRPGSARSRRCGSAEVETRPMRRPRWVAGLAVHRRRCGRRSATRQPTTLRRPGDVSHCTARWPWSWPRRCSPRRSSALVRIAVVADARPDRTARPRECTDRSPPHRLDRRSGAADRRLRGAPSPAGADLDRRLRRPARRRDPGRLGPDPGQHSRPDRRGGRGNRRQRPDANDGLPAGRDDSVRDRHHTRIPDRRHTGSGPRRSAAATPGSETAATPGSEIAATPGSRPCATQCARRRSGGAGVRAAGDGRCRTRPGRTAHGDSDRIPRRCNWDAQSAT